MAATRCPALIWSFSAVVRSDTDASVIRGCRSYPVDHNPRRRYHPRMASPSTSVSLPFTGDDEADRLLVEQPLAMLIGFALDQQVTVQKAFYGPLEIRRRLGTLDAASLAAVDPDPFADAFPQRPAIHRFPAPMAPKVPALCAAVPPDYDGERAG